VYQLRVQQCGKVRSRLPLRRSPLLIALEHPRSCSAATTPSTNYGILIRQDWDPATECNQYHAVELRPVDRLRSPNMVETSWRDFYRAAILELDRSLLKVRVKAAEDAIKARLEDGRASREERREMEDALSILQRLKKVDR
jgi:hypothetical protein